MANRTGRNFWFQAWIDAKLRHERMSIDAQDLTQLCSGQSSRRVAYQLNDGVSEITESWKADILILPDSEGVETSDNREREVHSVIIITTKAAPFGKVPLNGSLRAGQKSLQLRESHHLSRKKFVHRPIKKFFFYHVGSILNIVVVYGIYSTIYYDITTILRMSSQSTWKDRYFHK